MIFQKLKIKPFHILVILIFALATAQIIFSNKVATSGEFLKQLDEEALSLESENKKLQLEIASQASMERLKITAKKKGFTDKIEVANLASQKEIALNY